MLPVICFHAVVVAMLGLFTGFVRTAATPTTTPTASPTTVPKTRFFFKFSKLINKVAKIKGINILDLEFESKFNTETIFTDS